LYDLSLYCPSPLPQSLSPYQIIKTLIRGTARGRTRSTMEPEVPAAASDVQDNHTADEGDGAQKKAESIVKVGHVDSFV